MNDDQKQALQEFLFEQAKKCQTASGGGLLLAIKNHLSGYPTYGGCNELWQVADLLAGRSEWNTVAVESVSPLTPINMADPAIVYGSRADGSMRID